MLSSVIPIVTVRKFVNRMTSKILIKGLLYLSGLLSINAQATPLIDTYSTPQEVETPKGGDVIICNCASYLNLFWLQSEYSPIFLVPCDSKSVYVFGFFAILAKILSSYSLTSKNKLPLNKVVQEAKRLGIPVVIFPEGSVTNGEQIINFRNFGNDLDTEGINFHIYGFVHFGSVVSPNFTYGNGLLHLFKMIGRLFSGMKIKVALPQDIPKTTANTIDAAWIAKCRSVMSTIMGVKTVDIEGDEFEKFSYKNKRRVKKQHND